MAEPFAIRSRRVVLPTGERAATVEVADGRISAVREHADEPGVRLVVDLGDVALLPGLVDTHVHVNEPGRTDWEGYPTATRAAAAGGVTTIVDMPLNSLPPTVDPTALAVKRASAAGQVFVDVAFWGGAVPDSIGRLRDLHDAGVLGFKCFTTDSGVPEFPPLSWPQVRDVLAELATFDGLLAVHAEDAVELANAPKVDDASFASFVRSRPAVAEVRAVATLVDLLHETGARAHVLHVSSADALAEVDRARSDGVRVTAETCPHYLTLTTDDAVDTTFKCCPPIRDAANRERLWDSLTVGSLACVVSDHSPCTPELKEGGYATAWGGIASLQLGLPLMWTEARERGHGLTDVVRWMASGPAELVGLAGKGRIEVGCDADLVAFAPEETWTVDPALLHHRHPTTPYAGRTLTGRPRMTWLHGAQVGRRPAGDLLAREEA